MPRTRLWAILCTLSLALLSWTPGPYMVRSGVLSGHEEHFLAYFLSALLFQKHSAAQRPKGACSRWANYICPGAIQHWRIFARAQSVPSWVSQWPPC